ncbi:hypothetical protein AHIS1636_38570 [Arthrobacter mangrovi]|uniref:Uncharacterized protein n=1 Tax=Arthrobacter mangrovi TaxID=2966350 RepID=A0ABQ5MZN9_9MICC|nr:hypothetical protein AHIS1636_38570 [Arthrobacter mangrovi]
MLRRYRRLPAQPRPQASGDTNPASFPDISPADFAAAVRPGGPCRSCVPCHEPADARGNQTTAAPAFRSRAPQQAGKELRADTAVVSGNRGWLPLVREDV